MKEEISRTEVIRWLRKLVADKRTATLYVRTNHNRMAMIGIKKGEIVTLVCGPKRGMKAIPLLQEMSSAVVNEENTAVAHHSDELPPTSTILAMIEAGGEMASFVGDGSPASQTFSPMAAMASAGFVKTISARATLVELLTDYMGPIASMVCDDALDSFGPTIDNPAKLREAIDRIARELNDIRDAKAFAAQAKKLLNL